MAVERTEPCYCSAHYKQNLAVASDSHVDLDQGQQEDDALIYTSPEQARTGTEIRTLTGARVASLSINCLRLEYSLALFLDFTSFILPPPQ